MSENKTKYYRLSACVDDFLDEKDLHNSFYQKSLKWAIKAVKEIRFDIFQQPITKILPVTERKTVVLPDDFVDWLKVGVKKGQYVITLAVNAELAESERHVGDTTVLGLLSQNMPNGTDFSRYGGYLFNNFNGTSFLGCGGGLPSKGYFKVVDNGNCKEIILDYDYSFPQVYLEYISDGIACGETIIHPYEYDYIFKYMESRYERNNNPKATNYTKETADRDLFDEGLKLRARYNDLDPKTLITLSRSEARMTTKL